MGPGGHHAGHAVGDTTGNLWRVNTQGLPDQPPRVAQQPPRVVQQPRPEPPRAEHQAAEPCWLCGARLPAAQMVADGGAGCPDIRWYCRDAQGCTHRWTTKASASAQSGGYERIGPWT